MEHQEVVIEIYPEVIIAVNCVKCNSTSVAVHDYLFTGIHVLVDCTCKECTTHFYHTLPAGHDALWSTAFNETLSRYEERAKIWLSVPLIDSIRKPLNRIHPEIIKKNIHPLKKDIVLLNCLDSCFGHSYVKMLNAQQNFQGRSLVLIITPNLEWLVPEHVDELWIVQAPMREMKKFVSTLNEFVKKQLQSISTCVLDTAKVYHDLPTINPESFLKTKPFDLSKFDQLPKTITFVLRDDRFWHSNRLEQLIYLASIKFKTQSWFRKYFLWKQNRIVQKTIQQLDKSIVVNIISTVNFTPELEKKYCEIYSQSHLIIGVHGSNMLIPTALAGGFIEILPDYKKPHQGEDTVARNPSRSTHIPQFSAPALVASLIKKFI